MQAMHTDADIACTVAAYERAFAAMVAEGTFPPR